jgi:NAD(P)-dependent dehydrogenase (short-subunit alcohol dehydrogenase family)
MTRLQRKNALVTGGSRGIGHAVSLALASEGANVAVNYYRHPEPAEAVVREIERLDRRATAIRADVANPKEAQALINTATDALGSIDLLINNVGEFFFSPLADMDVEQWHRVQASNLNSVFYLCRAALPGMRKAGGGCIVNFGLSTMTFARGAANVAAYSTAKLGVAALTKSLATEEAANDIRVNVVSPGLIDNGHLPAQQKVWMQERVPMKRLGTCEEVAQAVVFLCSDQASYISGANLAVSGGWDWNDRPRDHDRLVTPNTFDQR